MHTTTIAPVGPSGPGALPGFEVRCSCGFSFRTAFVSTARLDAAEHVRVMSARPRWFAGLTARDNTGSLRG